MKIIEFGEYNRGEVSKGIDAQKNEISALVATCSDESMLRELLRDYMKNLELAGVIEKTGGTAPYCANPHLVRERRETAEGYIFKWRYTFDFRSQNKLVKEMGYRMPLMKDLLTTASSKGRFYMSYDLCQYFFQLPIWERSRDITSFSGHNLEEL